jgi:hypothetical protein
MKVFIKNIMIFAGFAGAIYLILILSVGTVKPTTLKNLNYVFGEGGHLHSRLGELDKVKQTDILFLGSSHAYRSYDVRKFRQLGYSVFNLGSNSQTPVQTEYFLQRNLSRLNPKLVVLVIQPEQFNSDGVESVTDLVSNSRMNSNLLKMALNTENIKVYNTLIYSMFRQIAGRNEDYTQPARRKDDMYISGGYVQTNRSYRSAKHYAKTHYTFSQEQLSAFRRSIETLKERNIKFVMVRNPVTKKSYEMVTNNKEVDSVFSSLGEYYNFNNYLKLPNKYFYDDRHLNQSGVNIFNAKLIERLSRDGIIKLNQKPNKNFETHNSLLTK